MLFDQGPTGVFDSTMTGTITRFCDIELITASVTFSVLTFKFPTDESQEISAAATYTNNNQILRYVTSFRVSSGAVLVHFHAPKGAPVALPTIPTAGLILQLDAESLDLGNGDSVAQWTDLSGAGNHLVQAVGASQPLYILNGVNGYPIVRFDGVDDSLAKTSADFTALTQATIFVVRNNVSNYPSLTIPATASINNEFLMYARRIYHHTSNGNYNFLDHQDTITGFFQQSAKFGTGATSLDQWINGVHSSQSVTGVGSPTNYTSVARTCYMGVREEAPEHFFQGDIAAALIYNTLLSDTDRLTVENFLRTKYGL